jgi:hypothetical protein
VVLTESITLIKVESCAVTTSDKESSFFNKHRTLMNTLMFSIVEDIVLEFIDYVSLSVNVLSYFSMF